MRSDPQVGFSIQAEAQRVIRHLCSMPTVAIASVTSRVVKEIMLSTDGRVIAAGKLYDVVAKSQGAGIYRLTTKEV